MGQHRSRMLTVQQFRSLYGEEELCWAQLNRQRWPEGFRCPRCSGSSRGYMVARRLHECTVCGYQSSVPAGTISTAPNTAPLRHTENETATPSISCFGVATWFTPSPLIP